MTAKKVKFWENADGSQSSTKIISFLFAIFFFYFVPTYLNTHEIDVNFLSLIGELLLAIFAPKYIKQYLENRLKQITEVKK